MTIEIHNPEVERLVNQAVLSGQYGSPQDVVIKAIVAWSKTLETVPVTKPHAKNLVELFENSPFKGLDMEFERDRTDCGRELDL